MTIRAKYLFLIMVIVIGTVSTYYESMQSILMLNIAIHTGIASRQCILKTIALIAEMK